MKKMFAVVVLFLVIGVTFSGCNLLPQENNVESTQAPTEIEPDYTLYKPYMKEVLDNMSDDDYAKALGILYDVDENDVAELIMMYDSDAVKHPDSDMVGMAVAYSVYTIDGDEVVEIEKEHFLFPLAGGPQGTVYILERYKETPLLGFKYSEINPGDNELYCLGNWYIYSIGESSDNHLYSNWYPNEVEYYYSYTLEDGIENIDYLDSSAKSEEKDGTYEWFHIWLSEHKPTEILHYSLDNDEHDLETLMNTL